MKDVKGLDYVRFGWGEWLGVVWGLVLDWFGGAVLGGGAGRVVRVGGDWRGLIGVGGVHLEKQRQNGLETMACTTFGTLNAYELLRANLGHFGPVGLCLGGQCEALNCSDRYTASLSKTTRKGNTPQNVMRAVRDFGLLPETRLPWGSDIVEWDQFYNHNAITKEMVAEARTFVRGYELQGRWLWRGAPGADVQFRKIKAALEYGPVGIGVTPWAVQGGEYVRVGTYATHWTLVVGVTESGGYWVLDSYEPHLKQLKKGYLVPFALGYRLGGRGVA
jgi:hypothetical protein